MNIKGFFCAVLLLPSLALAEQYWSVTNVTVEEVSYFYENGNNNLRVVFSKGAGGDINDDPVDGIRCDANTVPVEYRNGVYLYQASMLYSNHAEEQSMAMSQLLAAQAQGFPVDLLIDHGASCNEDDRYFYNGLGRKFLGVRVKKPN